MPHRNQGAVRSASTVPSLIIISTHGPANTTEMVTRLSTSAAATRYLLDMPALLKALSHHMAQNGPMARPAKLTRIRRPLPLVLPGASVALVVNSPRHLGDAQAINPFNATRIAGSISAGATSQQIAPRNPKRDLLLLQNLKSATETLFHSFGSRAMTDGSC